MRSLNLLLLPFVLLAIAFAQENPSQTPSKPPFKLQEVMIPVRDGVHLQTAILTPVDQLGPFLFSFAARRTGFLRNRWSNSRLAQ